MKAFMAGKGLTYIGYSAALLIVLHGKGDAFVLAWSFLAIGAAILIALVAYSAGQKGK